MSSSIGLSPCPENCMLSSSAVLRRQLFVIRCLGGYYSRPQSLRMQAMHGSTVVASEADAEKIIRTITPALDPIRYKGQAGNCFMIV